MGQAKDRLAQLRGVSDFALPPTATDSARSSVLIVVSRSPKTDQVLARLTASRKPPKLKPNIFLGFREGGSWTGHIADVILERGNRW